MGMTALVLWHRLYRCKHLRAKPYFDKLAEPMLYLCRDCDTMISRRAG